MPWLANVQLTVHHGSHCPLGAGEVDWTATASHSSSIHRGIAIHVVYLWQIPLYLLILLQRDLIALRVAPFRDHAYQYRFSQINLQSSTRMHLSPILNPSKV